MYRSRNSGLEGPSDGAVARLSHAQILRDHRVYQCAWIGVERIQLLRTSVPR
jgi:hypothetical protein